MIVLIKKGVLDEAEKRKNANGWKFYYSFILRYLKYTHTTMYKRKCIEWRGVNTTRTKNSISDKLKFWMDS